MIEMLNIFDIFHNSHLFTGKGYGIRRVGQGWARGVPRTELRFVDGWDMW